VLTFREFAARWRDLSRGGGYSCVDALLNLRTEIEQVRGELQVGGEYSSSDISLILDRLNDVLESSISDLV
jgi:hypothetical protein